MSGKGLCAFFSRTDLDEIYAGFTEMGIELGSWTLGNMAHLIELWIVTCRKPV